MGSRECWMLLLLRRSEGGAARVVAEKSQLVQCVQRLRSVFVAVVWVGCSCSASMAKARDRPAVCTTPVGHPMSFCVGVAPQCGWCVLKHWSQGQGTLVDRW